jgi:hypothetical protein
VAAIDSAGSAPGRTPYLKTWLVTIPKRNFPQFFDALQLLCGSDAVLGLDGYPRKELEAALDRLPAPASRPPLPKGWKESRVRFLPATPEVLRELGDWAERSASPEIAIFLWVCDGKGWFLEWYDLPDDPIQVSGRIEEAAVDRFATALGGRYEVEKS